MDRHTHCDTDGTDLLPMKTAMDLWSNIIVMELQSPHMPSLLEPFLI